MKKMIIFALIMAISVATPIQAMAESVTQSDVEMQPSEQNIEQIIDEITSETHPINSDAIQNVKEYIIQYWGDLGYDEIECQKFEYNDENNENAIRRSSQVDVFLAPTAENATIDGTGENIIVTKKSSTDMTKNLIITSEALGVYNRVIYISEDGYFATNIFDYEYSYFIGKEAAGQIISYVQKHSAETKSSTSLPTISGTVTEIGNGYIMVDDTVLCKKSKAGKKYKVYTDDIKIRRWIESGELKEGDLVIVEYEGEISSNYEVKGAYSIFTGTLEENGILNQE